MSEPNDGATGAERRQWVRRSICLPVKFKFLSPPSKRYASSSSMRAIRVGDPASIPEPTNEPPAVDATLLHALAIDLSEGGLQLETSGSALHRYLDEESAAVRVEVHFVSPTLQHVGARPANVRWRRAGGRNAWVLGLELDAPLTAADVLEATRLATPRATPWGSYVACFAVPTLLLSALWFRSCTLGDDARERLSARTSDLERSAEQANKDLEACVAARAEEQRAAAHAVRTAIALAPSLQVDAGAPSAAVAPLDVRAADREKRARAEILAEDEVDASIAR